MKIKAAGKYFAYVGKHFPVMCASGAFPLMPPVSDAAKWLDRFDDLSKKAIARHVSKLKKFICDFESFGVKAQTPEERATVHALIQSASGALAELDGIRTWEKCPEFYLQIAFTGLAQAADMPSSSDRAREKRFTKRLKSIPSLLSLAPENIEAISTTSRGITQTMIRDCARYLTHLKENDLGRTGKAPRLLQECLTSLKDFDRFIASHPEMPEDEGPPFAQMLKEIAGSDKSPESIFAIAEEEYDNRIQSLCWLESEIDSGWREAFKQYPGPAEDGIEAMDVVVREIHRLRSFIFDTGLPGIFKDSALRIEQQPQHLASTLRPIHYDPALGAWPDEPSRCHVSPQIFTGRGFRDDPSHLARMRREFIFMAARQSYPGRHLLDSQRRALGDNPMSQVTNPLFMAGWLAFAENLLDELGYLEKPLDRLIHHQRGLSRAALAMIDAGLAAGTLDQDKCLEILRGAGFSTEESLTRVRAIRLTPASRVMPVLGLHELKKIRKNSKLNTAEFCKQLFAHGQVPLCRLSELMQS